MLTAHSICSCFLIGFGVTACSIIRLTHLFSLNNSHNPTWDFAQPGLWSLVEVYTCMICCCTPAMAGFLHRLYKFGLEKQWSSLKGSISSSRSDSRLTYLKGEGTDQGTQPREKGTPNDILHVEKAVPWAHEKAEFASMDGTEGGESRPRDTIARIPSEANVVETVLQHPAYRS